MMEKDSYFKTFCKISKAFGTMLSTEKLLALIVESAISAMDAKAACLFLADEEKDLFVPVAQKGLSKNYLHAKPLQAKAIVANVLNGGYLYIRDATADSRVEHHDLKRAEGIATLLVVPVIAHNKTIGILSLYTGQTRDFSPDEIEFLATLAEQGGLALGQARLIERIQNNSKLLLELTASINSSLDIKKVLHILSAETCERLGMKGVCIRLINPDTGALNRVAAYGLSETYQARNPRPTNPHVAEVLDGKTVVIEDVANDKQLQDREKIVKEGIASMLCVPIKSKEEVIGTMELVSATQRNFPAETITILEALAHTGALAIRNASMYLKLQQDKECLEKDIWSHRSWF
jgi:GAF domain-containing protein